MLFKQYNSICSIAGSKTSLNPATVAAVFPINKCIIIYKIADGGNFLPRSNKTSCEIWDQCPVV